ncbi:uncharacterized protein LOC119661845 [Teleopsis dalmanni]|uniref:uncharacterized protein LOC119661845 n=1 Tax=Teleopsis dalmanni TaxID=139649 RepID=UPI0018CF44B9|nr:uncharacterized protein LOC119661845 [Teleopsis dalmanni]
MSGDGYKTKAVIDISEEVLPKQYFTETIDNTLFIVEQRDIRTITTTRHVRYKIATDNVLHGREYPPSSGIEESVQKHFSVTETLSIPENIKTNSLLVPRITFNVVDDGPNYDAALPDDVVDHLIPFLKKNSNRAKNKHREKAKLDQEIATGEIYEENDIEVEQNPKELDRHTPEKCLSLPKVSAQVNNFSINNVFSTIHEEDTEQLEYPNEPVVLATKSIRKKYCKKKVLTAEDVNECISQYVDRTPQSKVEVINEKPQIAKKKSTFSKVGDSPNEERVEKYSLTKHKRGMTHHCATQTNAQEMDQEELVSYLAKKSFPNFNIEDIDHICESVLKTVIAVHEQIKKHKSH